MRSAIARSVPIVALVLCGSAVAVADVRETLLEGQAQFEQGHYEQALKLYKQADEAEAGHPAVTYDMALCHLRLDDAPKAIQQFETVATQQEVNRALRRDAFYNIGHIRASSAKQKLTELFAPASQPAEQVPPDAPANIDKLQQIADELLRAIGAFRKSREIEPGEAVEHNIRAARITRRNVLGLLKKAVEQKEKQDILDDPRAYLEALTFEQHRQVSLVRWLVLNPIQDAKQARQARRAALRLQREIMERTGTFGDNLAQFKEAADQQAQTAKPAAPSTQPAEATPREKVYHAVAKQVQKVTESQRDACAFLLDGEVPKAYERQAAGLDGMYVASYMFPLDASQALVKARTQQAALKELVSQIASREHWLRDPLMPDATVPAAAKEPADKTPIHYHQTQLGNLLSILRLQCEHIAATSQPAEQAAPKPEQENPLLDPELNAKLVEALTGVDELRTKCREAIAAQDKPATLAAQEELLKIIEAALEVLPKTIEQRITELIVRQGRLNSDVKGQVGEGDTEASKEKASPMDKVRQWAGRLKTVLFGDKPVKVAEGLRKQQQGIQTDTVAVNDEIKQQIPSGAGAASQPAATAAPPASQPAEVQAYIEASKHLDSADGQMSGAVGGFDQAMVENSLKPVQAGGPVQTAQAKAVEELVKALAALRPPTTQPQQDEQNQKEQKQQQQQQDDQDTERQVEQLDNEREREMRELYQKTPRTVIKDW